MDKFWQFAKQMLQYRRLLTVAFAAAVFDAICAGGGVATLLWVIDLFFDKDATLPSVVGEMLSRPAVQQIIGDQTALLAYVPESKFAGFGIVVAAVWVLAVLGSTGRFIHQYAIITVSLRTVMQIRKAVFQRLVHAPLHVLHGESVSDKLSRVVRDGAALAGGFNTLLGRSVRDVLQGMAFLVVAIFVDWQLTLIFLTVIPLVAVALRKFGKRIRRASQRAMFQYGMMLGAISESLHALRVVKTNQAEGYERRRFNKINREVLSQEMRARTAKALSSPVVEMLAITAGIVVALVAAYLAFEVGHDPQDFFKVLVPLMMAGAAFRPVSQLNNVLQEAAAAAERIEEMLHLEIEPTRHGPGEQPDRIRLPRHRESVVFDAVTFTYPGNEVPALKNVNLTVPQGKVCAIVGPNGSGKTTLVGLLPRLYRPVDGRVLIDGHDIAEVSLRSLRDQISVVTQETVLFEGTVRENLIYGRRHADEDEVVAAAKQAHAHEFIVNLPKGYDTDIGEGGDRLSGGQRQRLSIARAILRDPAILILDEATSQIDADSEAKIAHALSEFMVGRTTFVIAHRLSTVINADMIVVMADGRVDAIGKHQQLLQTSDVYRTMCRTQLQPAEA